MLSLTLKGRYTPHSTLSKDSVISSLFNVVIETQGQIYTPIPHYQRREWSLHCSMLSLTLKGRYTPPVNSSKGQSDLFTVQCCHWHSKADILPIQHWQRTEWSLHCSMLSLTLKGRYTPHSTLSEDRVISSLFNVVIDTQRQIYPHSQHYQRTEWSLHCSLLALTLKGRYTPHSTLLEDRVISSLFNVVIDTQREIYPPFNTVRGQSDLFTVECCHWHSKADIHLIQHYQRTEWSLHCSMLSWRLKGRYTPTVNTIRGQSDLFTVQCCHWHSKADITPWSTLSEHRLISSLFSVFIDNQRQIYPPFNTIRGQSDLFTVQCFHWHSKRDIPPNSTLSEDRVISSLFNVVIDTQRQIHPLVNIAVDMISSLFIVGIDNQRQINPPFNTIRGQSDLFTVQCYPWDSKADIPPSQHYQRTEWSLHCWVLSLTLKGRYTPQSTLSEDRVISSLFNVVIDTQRQIYPPFNTIRVQSDLFTVQCCHWHSKADIPPWST